MEGFKRPSSEPIHVSQNHASLPLSNLQWTGQLSLTGSWAFRVLHADYQVPADAHVSARVADLLAGMLVVDPSRRMTIQQIMRHPWFRYVCFPHRDDLLSTKNMWVPKVFNPFQAMGIVCGFLGNPYFADICCSHLY